MRDGLTNDSHKHISENSLNNSCIHGRRYTYKLDVLLNASKVRRGKYQRQIVNVLRSEVE